MRVVYLFNRLRTGQLQKIERGETHDNAFYGMLRLRQQGIEAEHLEPEMFYSEGFLKVVRHRILNIYYIHLLVFPKLFSYDVVFTSTAFGSQFFLTLLKSIIPFKKPRWVMHDFSITGFLGNGTTLKQKLFKFMVKRAAGIITIDQHEQKLLVDLFPEKKNEIAFVRLGSDLNFFRPLQLPERNRILAVGTDYGRDYETFVKAASNISADVLIAARASKMRYKKPLPAHMRLEEFPAGTMPEVYAQSKIIVLPLDISGRYNDAMGCSTVIEAMAMGKAIIATRTPAIESYITDGETGLLVEPKNPEALHAAIERLLTDSDLRARLGANARAFAEKNLDADMIAGQLANFFRSLK